MPSRAARTLVALIGAAVLAAPGAASSQEVSPPDDAQDSAHMYLQRMIDSARSSTFQTKQLVVYLGPTQSAALLDVHSSPRGTFVRAERRTEVTQVWRTADHGIVSDSQQAIEDAAPPAVPLELPMITSKYEVQVGSPSDLLGAEVVPLALVRRSDDRLVERLWIESGSGVVYRRELFGNRGELVGMSTVLDMQWGEPQYREPYRGRTPTKVRSATSAGAPRTLPYGYKLVSASTMDAGAGTATHWVYSDGLHALSVFRSAGLMKAPANYRSVGLQSVRGWVGPGPGTWTWQGGPATWTLVADEPQLDPVQLTRAFPQGGPSLLSRLGSWWSGGFRWAWSRLT